MPLTSASLQNQLRLCLQPKFSSSINTPSTSAPTDTLAQHRCSPQLHPQLQLNPRLKHCHSLQQCSTVTVYHNIQSLTTASKTSSAFSTSAQHQSSAPPYSSTAALASIRFGFNICRNLKSISSLASVAAFKASSALALDTLHCSSSLRSSLACVQPSDPTVTLPSTQVQLQHQHTVNFSSN